MNGETLELYYNYWGKAAGSSGEEPLQFHRLVYHCLDVAAVGRTVLLKDHILCDKIISSSLQPGNDAEKNRALDIISHLLALHDIGKFSGRFQNLRPDIMETLQGRRCENEYTVYHDDMGRLLFEEDLWKQAWIENWFGLNLSADPLDWRDALRPWVFAVTGHHGKPPEKPKNNLTVSMLFDADDRKSALTFAEASAGLFLKTVSSRTLDFSADTLTAFHRTSWLLAGLAVLSDWIGSDSRHFPFCTEPIPLEKYWNEYALPYAEDAVRDAGILPSRVSEKIGMQALFPGISSPTPLQSHVSVCKIGESHSPRMVIIEEATGSGKTEAALVLAQRLIAEGNGEGIFFGLPTMATADAMYGRMEHAYLNLFNMEDRPSLILAHSSRKLSEKFRNSIVPISNSFIEPDRHGERSASAQCTAWLSDNRKKSLLAQIGVGTIDQALMGVLPLRHQSLRLLGLSRNILVVDEVHAYDPYVHKVLETLLEFHAAQGGSAILLSATLPQKQRQELINGFCKGLGKVSGTDTVGKSNYPLVTSVSLEPLSEIPIERCEQTHRTISVECINDPTIATARLSDVVKEGRCACWVRNTVDDAIATYRELSSTFGSDHVILFHARFAMGDRLDIEHAVLETFGKNSTPEIRSGKILVATQVVEQSLDLDFDLMVTDLAPMDLIIQRAGRLHRHKREDRGTPLLIVLTPQLRDPLTAEWYSAAFPKGAYVYPHHGQLWLTARILADRKKITMPDDARLLIEGVFSDDVQGRGPEALTRAELQSDGKDMSHRAQANLNELKLDEGYRSTPAQWMDDARTQTRLGEPRVMVLLLKWDGSLLSFWSSHSEFAREMSQVSISEHKLSKESGYGGTLGIALEKFKQNLPDKGRWQVLVPLIRNNGEWSGSALNTKGSRVTVRYDPRTGLVVNKS
jgi:CRISPR-associated endonuclease/helicase Cas3